MVAKRLALAIVTLLAVGAAFGLARRGRLHRAKRSRARGADVVFADRDAGEGRDEQWYARFRSLDEARSMEHTAVVMQGKNGEQIYLTVPVKDVACDESTLRSLLAAIDALAWKEPQRALLTFELAPIGSGFHGGMGGGEIIDGVWMHENLQESGVLRPVSDVIYGRRTFDEARTDLHRPLR